MSNNLELIKGIHPGIILDRELRKRSLAKGRFALSINEFPQTISAIINGNRKMNTALSLKIENALDIEEGYFMTLQVFYDIKCEKAKLDITSPDISKIRPAIFWDTNINSIDWLKNKKAVIHRVFDKGNEIEKAEIKKFYTYKEVESVLNEPWVEEYKIYKNIKAKMDKK